MIRWWTDSKPQTLVTEALQFLTISYSGPDSTDSNLRYAAYATRIRTILLSAHRYVAYTSDIGESFRPVAHPNLVRAAYGISWLYILGDVSHEGYRAYWHNQRVLNPALELTPHQEKITGLSKAETVDVKPGVVSPLEDYRTVMLQRGIFQSLASMGLPAFTIHSVVRYSGRALKDAKNKTIRTWGPIGLGLAVVPFLPTLFDEPVENAVEWVFHKGFPSMSWKQHRSRLLYHSCPRCYSRHLADMGSSWPSPHRRLEALCQGLVDHTLHSPRSWALEGDRS